MHFKPNAVVRRFFTWERDSLMRSDLVVIVCDGTVEMAHANALGRSQVICMSDTDAVAFGSVVSAMVGQADGLSNGLSESSACVKATLMSRTGPVEQGIRIEVIAASDDDQDVMVLELGLPQARSLSKLLCSLVAPAKAA